MPIDTMKMVHHRSAQQMVYLYVAWTHWDSNEMATIWQMTFQTSLGFVCERPIKKYKKDNGLVPIKWHGNIFTNNELL